MRRIRDLGQKNFCKQYIISIKCSHSIQVMFISDSYKLKFCVSVQVDVMSVKATVIDVGVFCKSCISDNVLFHFSPVTCTHNNSAAVT